MTEKNSIPSIDAKKEKKKTPDTIDKHLMKELSVPTDEVWNEVFKEFNFNKSQKNELEIVLEHLREDIFNFNKITMKIGLRSENKRRLVELEKSLAKVNFFLEKYQNGMDDWLPFDMREEIGLLTNFLFAEDIIGEKTYSNRINREIVDSAYQQKPLTIERIEESLIVSRKSIGLLAGDKVLRHFIQRIHAPLAQWRSLEKNNKGGTPAEKTQRAVIYWLAWSAPDIIGKEAGTGKEGPFVRLCSAVLSACGIPNESIGSSVSKLVKKVREDKLKHKEWLEGKS